MNWKIIYIAFFINQDEIYKKFGLLRNEYLSQNFPPFSTWIHLRSFLIFPFALTLIFFWIFPFVTNLFYRKSLKNQKALKIIEIQETTQQRKAEKNLIIEEKNLIKEKNEKQKEVKKIEKENPEVIWQQEFNDFTMNPFFDDLGKIKDIVYSNGGKILMFNPRGDDYRMIGSGGLATAHLNGLIVLKNSGEAESLELTEKGKFFIANYIKYKEK